MSEILDAILAHYKDAKYYPITLKEKYLLKHHVVEDIKELLTFLYSDRESFEFPSPEIRIALFYTDHLVWKGCPWCTGDVAIEHTDAIQGKCCECGRTVTDYRV